MPPRQTIVLKPGDRFERLVVIETARLANTPGRARHGFKSGPLGARCRCDCGAEILATAGSLASGNTRSCGCLRIDEATARLPALIEGNRVHGLSGKVKHALYQTWRGMMARCYDERHVWYGRYGGRGITVCERWRDPARFVADIESAIGARPDGMTLDRIDNDGNYEPGNVRWASQAQQVQNRAPRQPRFTVEQVAAMRAQRAAGVPLREIAEEHGCGLNTIWRATT